LAQAALFSLSPPPGWWWQANGTVTSTQHSDNRGAGVNRGRSLKLASGILLAACLAGCASSPSHRPQHPLTEAASRPAEDVVQLRYATLPSALRAVAVHCWFVAFDHEKGEWSRWELWQKPAVVATSWGHVHQNLMPLDSGVGGGQSRVGREWRGKEARALMTVLNHPQAYPHRDGYRAWPGPNSNTYVAWVLKQAKISADLPPMAIGKDYCGLIGGGVSTTQTGIL
jgi:hypothetical protein